MLPGIALPPGLAGGALDTQTITTGGTGSSPHTTGYIRGTCGSISPGTSSLYGGANVNQLTWDTDDELIFAVSGNHPNSGWSLMTIGATSFTRASALYSYNGIDSSWTWGTAVSPLGTTNGVVKQVVFS